MKVKKVKASHVLSLEFLMKPVDGGQIVEVAYATDYDGVWMRIWDRSDDSVSYEFGAYPARCSPQRLEHEPWNGKIAAHNKFRAVEITD